MEDWVEIRNYKKRFPSLGTREIAKTFKVSRNTVKKALKSDEFIRYSRERKTNEDIAPFVEYIEESYLVKKQRISVIIENMLSKGYKGSGAAVYRYISSTLKERMDFSRAYMPYSTEPGEQMQFDWADYRINFSGVVKKVHVHSAILGYSRFRIYEPSLVVNQGTIFKVLETSFEELGGYCLRLQIDNARVFVKNPSKNSFEWNDKFLAFCGFYGITPTRSLPRHPWSKGKVENPFDYLNDHFITNNEFSSYEDFAIKLKEFQNKVNNRKHDTLNDTPLNVFRIEKSSLMPLLGKSFGIKEYRSVSKDCLISFDGSKYSVPFIYAEKEVWIDVKNSLYLNIYNKEGNLIATHDISLKKGSVMLNESHYEGYLRKDNPSFDISAEKLKQRFQSFEKIDIFLSGIKSAKKINPSYHLYKIILFFDYYSDEHCIKVMEEAMNKNLYSYKFVCGYLNSKALSINIISTYKKVISGVSVKRNMEDYRL